MHLPSVVRGNDLTFSLYAFIFKQKQKGCDGQNNAAEDRGIWIDPIARNGVNPNASILGGVVLSVTALLLLLKDESIEGKSQIVSPND